MFVQVSPERQAEPALELFERTVAGWPELMECYLMTGDADYLLRVVVSDIAAYERFLKERLTRVPGIASIKSSFALNQVKYETALPLAGEGRRAVFSRCCARGSARRRISAPARGCRHRRNRYRGA